MYIPEPSHNAQACPIRWAFVTQQQAFEPSSCDLMEQNSLCQYWSVTPTWTHNSIFPRNVLQLCRGELNTLTSLSYVEQTSFLSSSVTLQWMTSWSWSPSIHSQQPTPLFEPLHQYHQQKSFRVEEQEILKLIQASSQLSISSSSIINLIHLTHLTSFWSYLSLSTKWILDHLVHCLTWSPFAFWSFPCLHLCFTRTQNSVSSLGSSNWLIHFIQTHLLRSVSTLIFKDQRLNLILAEIDNWSLQHLISEVQNPCPTSHSLISQSNFLSSNTG